MSALNITRLSISAVSIVIIALYSRLGTRLAVAAWNLLSWTFSSH